MSAAKKTYHRRFIGENKLEEYDLPMTKHHWVKHKKESVDFADDAPFVLDRQLEDQRFQIRKNRNPQLDVLTKAEKTKSELALIKKVCPTHGHHDPSYLVIIIYITC
jgi:hypothetical protein